MCSKKMGLYRRGVSVTGASFRQGIPSWREVCVCVNGLRVGLEMAREQDSCIWLLYAHVMKE